MRKNKMVRLGSIGVDSGQVLITDPCYIHRFKDSKKPTPDFGDKSDRSYSYFGACCASLDEIAEDNHQLENGLGVCSGTFHGDGVYPVYAEIEDGRVKKLVIYFD